MGAHTGPESGSLISPADCRRLCDVTAQLGDWNKQKKVSNITAEEESVKNVLRLNGELYKIKFFQIMTTVDFRCVVHYSKCFVPFHHSHKKSVFCLPVTHNRGFRRPPVSNAGNSGQEKPPAEQGSCFASPVWSILGFLERCQNNLTNYYCYYY